MKSQRKIIVWCTLCALWFIPLSASAGRLSIEAPGPQYFVRDLADLVTPDDEVLIDEWCQALQTEHTVPVLVVTIESMAQHGGDGLLVETFARTLFEQWGNDIAFAFADDWRRGILLLISKNDRKARIELGGSWPPDYIARCIRIMDGVIVPQFKSGDYSGGTVAGVQAIADMVRGNSATTPESGAVANAPAEVLDETAPVPASPPTGQVTPPIPIRSAPVRQVTYPSQRVHYQESSSGVPPVFGLMMFAMAGLFVLNMIGKGLGLSSSSGGGFQNYGARHHHHHHGGIHSGFHHGEIHHGGHTFGGHSHGGSHSGGGGHSSGGSHGGGGGATGSW